MFRYATATKQNVLRTGHALSNAEIARWVPSVFAQEAHASRSDRYGYIDTLQVLDGLRSHGFEVFEARQARSRDTRKRGHAMHMLRLRHASIQAYSEGAPEIVVVNSHDGSTAMNIMAGYLRFVCENGLIAGDMLATRKVMHRGSSRLDDMVIDGCTRVLEDTQAITNTVSQWSQITVSRDIAMDFANKALALRWDEGKAPVEARDLLRVRRDADRGNSVWHLLNITQENLLRGGLYGRNAVGRSMTTRPITSMDGTVDINRRLWDLAADTALALA